MNMPKTNLIEIIEIHKTIHHYRKKNKSGETYLPLEDLFLIFMSKLVIKKNLDSMFIYLYSTLSPLTIMAFHP